jgi:hypothetical protein
MNIPKNTDCTGSPGPAYASAYFRFFSVSPGQSEPCSKGCREQPVWVRAVHYKYAYCPIELWIRRRFPCYSLMLRIHRFGRVL